MSFPKRDDVASDSCCPSPEAVRLGVCVGVSLVLHVAATGSLETLIGYPPPQTVARKEPIHVLLLNNAVEESRGTAETDPASRTVLTPSSIASEDLVIAPPPADRTQTKHEIPAAPQNSQRSPVLELPNPYTPGRHLDVKPRPKDEILPIYPEQASEREASVVLKLFISETGTVDRVEVVSESLDPAYAQSAVDAFMRGNFLPGRKGGVAVKSELQIVVDFRESRQSMKPGN